MFGCPWVLVAGVILVIASTHRVAGFIKKKKKKKIEREPFSSQMNELSNPAAAMNVRAARCRGLFLDGPLQFAGSREVMCEGVSSGAVSAVGTRLQPGSHG